jgi:hypothetical protein
MTDDQRRSGTADGSTASDLTFAVLCTGLTLLIDGLILWQLVWRTYVRAVAHGWGLLAVHNAEKSAVFTTLLLALLVCIGAVSGASSAGRGARATQRWRRAAAGALLSHLLLPVLLLASVMTLPLRFVW